MFLQASYAQLDTLFIDTGFKSVSLKKHSHTFSTNNELELSEAFKSKRWAYDNSRDYFYFSAGDKFNYIRFNIKNQSALTKNLFLEFNNPLISQIEFYLIEDSEFRLINKTGIKLLFSSRLVEHRNFILPITLEAGKSKAYLIQLKKEVGRSLVSGSYIKDSKLFKKHSFMQYLSIGFYFGISLLSVLFSVFVFYFLRISTYLIYGLYIIFLGVFLASYLGVFYQFFLGSESFFNKFFHYVLFSELTLLAFVILSQKILGAKEMMPKVNRFMNILIIALISVRLLLHFVFTEAFSNYVPFFMKIWYGFFLIAIMIIVYEIIIYYKTNKKKSSFFVIAFLFMCIGTFTTLLYHSFGITNAYVLGLPIIFYTSALEILFLTFTIIFMVKDIYDERNLLSHKLVVQQKGFLNAFMKGEDRERKRISKELHDNIGSKLGYLRRFVVDKLKDETVAETIDELCNDVRNLSHEISPSDLTLVGFESAVADLAKTISKQTSINVDFNSYSFPNDLNEKVTTQLYRVVQEAFNNIIKHSDSKFVDVQLIGHVDSVTISIEDDGVGFDKSTLKQGIGLKNMKSRVNQINGTLSIDSQLKNGTSIFITIPF